MSAHDLLTMILFGVCGNDHPEAEVENHGYNVAQGPMFKFGAQCCGRTGREDIENTPSEWPSSEEILILREEGNLYDEEFFISRPISVPLEITRAVRRVLEVEYDPCERFCARSGNPKRRRLRRPEAARIAVWMVRDNDATLKVEPSWVNSKTPMRAYIMP